MMKKINKISLILAFAFFGAMIANAGPVSAGCKDDQKIGEAVDKLDFTYKYYYIAGETYSELYKQLEEKGPMGGDGKRWPGLTNYGLNFGYGYSYSWDRSPDGDRVTIKIKMDKITLEKEIIVTLPALEEGVELEGSDKEQWDDFITNLDAHEKDHVTIVMDPGIEMRYEAEMRSITEIVVDLDRSEKVTNELVGKFIKEKADVIHSSLTKSVRHVNDKLDEITGHGIKPFDREVFLGWAEYYIRCYKY